jgi:hypothetical protein
MRRLNLVLLASLQLCAARQPGFSIQDDVLAYPQVRRDRKEGLGPCFWILTNSLSSGNLVRTCLYR